MEVTTLRYSVMVEVDVDLDTEKVTRVVVDDESATFIAGEDEDLADDAHTIAENNAWPQWQIGR